MGDAVTGVMHFLYFSSEVHFFKNVKRYRSRITCVTPSPKPLLGASLHLQIDVICMGATIFVCSHLRLTQLFVCKELSCLCLV